MSENDLALSDSAAIAVIGLAGRFPGARNVHEYFRNLQNGVESVRVFSDEELLAAGVTQEQLSDPSYVKSSPFLDDIEQFDAAFFGLSPRDAALMDPQHRFMLEVAWEALEDAGYDGERTQGPVGVFAACGMNTYMMHHLVPNAEVMQSVGEWLVRHTGNDMNFVATRVSYQMNLKGPSMTVQTACSSALSAVHLACQSLLNAECDMALAGASTMSLPQDKGYAYKHGEILSPDGHCRPFDAASRGTLFGSGTGCVVLKRLSDALRDRDHVYAVIRGSAVNNDGSQKVGYLAPSVEGQARAVAEALAISGVEADSISYVETHGTGTAVGDPIEIAALTQAYRAHTDKRQYCALGSVKANIGHLGEAAGIAGFIKTVLALEHRQLPPCINYQTPNPEIDFASSPFFVNTKLREWKTNGVPRRAGITALGAGGTNVHVILEEAPERPAAPPGKEWQLLLLSAKTSSALDSAGQALAEHLERRPEHQLADVAHTLQAGRKHFAHRRAIVCRDRASAIDALSRPDAKVIKPLSASTATPTVVFMFPGGGAQYPGMGRDLYEAEPTYRTALDACLATLPLELSERLRKLLLSVTPDSEAQAMIERPSLALPALFATEYALAKLLMSLGVAPAGCVGHSMGEYVAACLAEVFSVKDALALVSLRGRLFETLQAGAMLSVELPETELQQLLSDELTIAAINAPTLTVASGPVRAIDALETKLLQAEIGCSRIHISVAAHSPMLGPILGEFEKFCRKIQFGAPSLPFISNLTGTWITPQQATDPKYWVQHLRGCVRFADGIATLLQGGHRYLLEVGPGRTLSSLAKQHADTELALVTMRHPREKGSDAEFLLQALGRAFQAGLELDFEALHDEGTRLRLPLPTYPFERQRYWIDAPRGDISTARPNLTLRKKPQIDSWFYTPNFKPSALPKAGTMSGPWLIFCDEANLGTRIAARAFGRKVIRVVPGTHFAKVNDNEYAIRPGQRADFSALLDDLTLHQCFPEQIIYLWAVTAPKSWWTSLVLGAKKPRFDHCQGFYFDSLLFLAQALAEHENPLTLSVISSGAHRVALGEPGDPEKSLILGPVRVIPREFPWLRTRNIDLLLNHKSNTELDQFATLLLAELTAEASDSVVAYRNNARFVQSHDRTPIASADPERLPLKRGGVYWITGGLGGIGLEVAEHLAKTFQAKLVLIGRTKLPEREEWPKWLAEHPASDSVSQRIRKLRAIEAVGAQVLTFAADVTDAAQMQGVLFEAKRAFGEINGVIHSAGVIDDGLISLKTRENASKVIEVKALGALVIDQLLANEPLDFFVSFSSVSSVLGLEGQIDYTAANAFLDAFAERKNAGGKTRAISIGWNAWQEVGMAVALAERPSGQAERGRLGAHPCLERIAVETDDEWLFVTAFSRTKHWLLAEHVVHGAEALIPGTGFLELARAALQHMPGDRSIELRDVTFLSPFAVKKGVARELCLKLKRHNSSLDFCFFSSSEGEPHVTGKVGYVDSAPPATVALDPILKRCTRQAQAQRGFIDQPFVDFGPRWGNVERILFGSAEAVICLSLPAEFIPELKDFRLHPALLDMATGGAQPLIPGFDQKRDFYVPFAYGRLILHRPLTARVFSHVRYVPNTTRDLAVFDVTLFGAQGEVLAEIKSFTMKRVTHAAVMSGVDADTQATPSVLNLRAPPVRDPAAASRLSSVVRDGILPAEGMEAFDRILASGIGGHVLACSVDLPTWLARINAEAAPKIQAEPGSDTTSTQNFARPNLSTSFVAPTNAVQRELAEMWKELLGVKEVGIHDDFFELGGQSLVAVRLFNKIRKRYQADLPLSTLFEAPTIAQCARVVAEEAHVSLADEAPQSGSIKLRAVGANDTEAANSGKAPRPRKSRWSSLVPMQPKGELPPFYCVAGMGGTLNNLRKLALLVGDSRPFYGLQPPGADDPARVLYSVEELAQHYLEEIRRIQPQGPYFLGGYSGGGVAAFEVTRLLKSAGEEVAFLGFIDSFSPNLPQRTWKARASIHLARAREQGVTYLLQTAQRRYKYERWEVWRRVTRPLGKLFPERYRYDVIQDSWVVAEQHYQPAPWQGKATLFRAREESALSLWTAFDVDEQHGWGRYVQGGVDVQICPGNHSTMCEEPHVRVLAVKLREALDQATERVPRSGSRLSASDAPSPVSVSR